ncbi:hypothetical protein [Corynebacterium belfantii]|uniref:hypothetical protein n=1 Tax=Corynebacterium belfantii TaxID=2014537 RepID=UPI001F1D4B71|nr:hypothetical protein [Corynebacterium belfantii]
MMTSLETPWWASLTSAGGETIVAVVQPRPGATITIDALCAHCERHLVVVDEILRNSAGKIDKIGLRRLVEEELTQRAGSAV